MTAKYTGLPTKLREQVFARDNYRCRWCGVTNAGVDIHHIRYRTGRSADVLPNLITLCRQHHSFVHGIRDNKQQTIAKHVAQAVLMELIESPGSTGMAVLRAWRKRWAKDAHAMAHEGNPDTCPECASV